MCISFSFLPLPLNSLPICRQCERERGSDRGRGSRRGEGICLLYDIYCLAQISFGFFFCWSPWRRRSPLNLPVTFQSRAAICANLHFALATFELPVLRSPLSPAPLSLSLLLFSHIRCLIIVLQPRQLAAREASPL